MKKTFFFFFFLITILNSQEKELIELKSSKDNLLEKITELKDSIKKIDKRISLIKSKELSKIISETNLVGIIISKAKLKRDPNPYGKVISILKEHQIVNIIDYEEGYFKVCINSVCGFVSHIWIKNNEQIKNFIVLKKAEKIELNNNEKNKKYSELEKRFGKITANKILTKTYWIGMTKDMAVLSIGKPKHINRSVGT